MERQQNPNGPGKGNPPGQQGAYQKEDRDRHERERQRRVGEKQGGQPGEGGQQKSGQHGGR